MLFVVPLAYSHSPFGNMELRYMLRSLCDNYTDGFDVVVVGDKKPEWYTGRFEHCERPVLNIDYENFYDTLLKLKYVAHNLEDDRFVYIYDDICLLRWTGDRFFNVSYYMEEKPLGNKWGSTISKSLELCPGRNFETHIPVMFDRRKLKMMFDSFPFSLSSVPYAPITLYKNVFGERSKELGDELCYNFVSDGSVWLNYTDAFFEKLKLGEMFPFRSRYEK